MKTFKQVVGLKVGVVSKINDALNDFLRDDLTFGFSATMMGLCNITEDRINNGESLTIELLGKHETISGQPALVYFEEDDFVIEEVSYE